MNIGQRLRAQEGMTLMEVTMAVAIFAAVIAMTATALVDFYVGVDLQKQRIEAASSCRAVLSYLRERRPEMNEDFPATFLDHINLKQEEGWTEFLKHDAGDGITLDGHTITVVVRNMDGAEATDADNPIRIIVQSTWLDRAGRPMRAELATALTDQ